MDILVSILVILGLLVAVVIYQSRKEKPSPKLYLYRFSRLIVIVINYFKDVGVCAGQKFREINWDLTEPTVSSTSDFNNDGIPDQTQGLTPTNANGHIDNTVSIGTPRQQPIDNRKLSIYAQQEGGHRKRPTNRR